MNDWYNLNNSEEAAMKNIIRKTSAVLAALALLTGTVPVSAEETEVNEETQETIVEETAEETEEAVSGEVTEETAAEEQPAEAEPEMPAEEVQEEAGPAAEVIEETEEVTGKTETVAEEIAEEEVSEPVYFANTAALQPYAAVNSYVENDPFTMSNVVYSDGISMRLGYTGYDTGGYAEADYYLQGNYSQVSFMIGWYQNDKKNAKMTITLDGAVATDANTGTYYEEYELVYTNVAKKVTLNVSGVQRLVVSLSAGGYDTARYGLAGWQLTKAPGYQEPETFVSDEFYDVTNYVKERVQLMDEDFTINGKKYKGGYKMSTGYNGGYTAKVAFNFNNQYRHMSFDFGRMQNRLPETYRRSGKLTIEVDGTALPGYSEKEIIWNENPIHIDIDLNNVTQVVISLESTGYDTTTWGIGDIQLISDGRAHGILLARNTLTLDNNTPEYDLNPRVYPSDAADKGYTCSSDNELAAFVKPGGVVYAHKKGTANIVFKTHDGGHTAECKTTSNTLKYYPHLDGWGFRNHTATLLYLDSNKHLKVNDYFEQIYKRISGESELYAYGDVASESDNMMLKSQGLAIKIASSPGYIYYMLGGVGAEGGMCHGFSVTSAITFIDNIPFSTWETGDSEKYAMPADLKEITNDFPHSSEIDMYLEQFIFASHISQGTKKYALQQFANSFDQDYQKKLFDTVRNFQKYGTNPAVLLFSEKGHTFKRKHTVMPYKIVEKDKEIDLYIYDSNLDSDPDDNYIKFDLDSSGKIIHWDYDEYDSDHHMISWMDDLAVIGNRIKNYQTSEMVTRIISTEAENFTLRKGTQLLMERINGVTTFINQNIAVPLGFSGALTDDSANRCDIAVLTNDELTLETNEKAAVVYYTDNASYVSASDSPMTITFKKNGTRDYVTIDPEGDDDVFFRYNHDHDSIEGQGGAPDKILVNADTTNNKISIDGYADAEIKTLYDDKPVSKENSDLVVTMKRAEGVFRIYGKDRYETSMKIADALKEVRKIDKFDCVIVASGSSFADALAGGYLASKKNAPILITNAANESRVRNYIKENLKDNGLIYILGGPAAVAETMERGYKSTVTVKRLAGDTRYQTNIEILKEAGVGSNEIIVARGDGKKQEFADSLSASAAKKPILLVNKNKGLTEDQISFLKGLSRRKYYIAGGEAAVTKETAESLNQFATEIERLGGESRFETSKLIALKFIKSTDQLVLAYSSKFPDGLCGGPLAMALNAPLILTRPTKEDEAADYAGIYELKKGYVLGGASLISDESVMKILITGKVYNMQDMLN